jgi:hypothetical protein
MPDWPLGQAAVAARKHQLVQARKLILLSPAQKLALHLAWVHGLSQHGGELPQLEQAHREIMTRSSRASCRYFTTGAEEKAS